MLRPLQISKVSAALFLAGFLSVGAVPATGATRGHNKTDAVHHNAAAARAARESRSAQPTAPKSPAELQQELAGYFKAGRFTNDSVQVQVEPQKIILTGMVHGAESKGLATTQSRLIARKDGWENVHVMNHLQVSLPEAW